MIRTRLTAPSGRSIWIEAVAAVKLFKIERAERIAAGRVRPTPCEAEAGCDYFGSFDLEELDGGDRLDPDGPVTRRREARADQRCDLRPFGADIGRYDRSHLP